MYLIKSRGSRNIILRYFIAIPLMLLMIVPIIIADICFELYHHIVFPILGIRMLNRSQYIRITDRAKLPYLSLYEKLECAYCGYANGWLHYASVIGGRTESYFCAIAHLEARGYIPTEQEKSFMKYGDESALKKRYFMHDLKYGSENMQNNK